MAFERYGQEGSVAFTADRLQSLVGTWIHELNDLHLPWGRAIAELCFSLVGQLLKECAITLVSAAGKTCLEASQAVRMRRPLAAMGMDQFVELFERIDPLLTDKLKSQYPLSSGPEHLISACDLRLLHKLSKMSRHAGPKPFGPEDANRRALHLLSCAAELCHSSLVATARRVEAKNTQH